MERAIEASKIHVKPIGRGRPPDRTEFFELKRLGIEAQKKLTNHNLRLVISIARKYSLNDFRQFPDRIQDGNIGLMRAIQKWDYRRELRFSTYATWWIRQAVTRAKADTSRLIRLPVHQVDTLRRIYKITKILVQTYGRTPTEAEIARELTTNELEKKLGRAPTQEEIKNRTQVMEPKVTYLLKMSRDPASLETPVGDEEDSTLGDFVPSPNAEDGSVQSDVEMLQELIQIVFHELTPREVRVLTLRNGLLNGHIFTLEEVGAKMGVTRERIRQIEKQAYHKLRHPHIMRRLRPYLNIFD